MSHRSRAAEQVFGIPNGNGKHTRAEPHPNGQRGDADVSPTDEVHATDLGNARRVVERHGNDLRFVHPWKCWLVWDGRRWSEDQTAEVVRRVKQTQGAFYAEIVGQLKQLQEGGNNDGGSRAERKSLIAQLAHAIRWEDARAIARTLELMRSEPGVPLLPDELDRDPFLLNVLTVRSTCGRASYGRICARTA